MEDNNWVDKLKLLQGDDSQAVLARRLSVSHATIKNWIKGATPSTRMQVRILSWISKADELGIKQTLADSPKDHDSMDKIANSLERICCFLEFIVLKGRINTDNLAEFDSVLCRCNLGDVIPTRSGQRFDN